VVEDQDGARQQLIEFLRRADTVLAFFYTRCQNPNKCSLTVTKLADLQARMMERGLAGQLAAITYDPGFDLPPRLAAYGRARGLQFGNSVRMFRTVEGHARLAEFFGLRVGYTGTIVNQHGLESYLVDAGIQVVRTRARIPWEVPDVLNSLKVAHHSDPSSDGAPTNSAEVFLGDLDYYRAVVAANIRRLEHIPFFTYCRKYARHAGHADIARELIDGDTGERPWSFTRTQTDHPLKPCRPAAPAPGAGAAFVPIGVTVQTDLVMIMRLEVLAILLSMQAQSTPQRFGHIKSFLPGRSPEQDIGRGSSAQFLLSNARSITMRACSRVISTTRPRSTTPWTNS
jgi:cytochrome oxidase Cu insertion factor (SCO1/SenC/PrrC family)